MGRRVTPPSETAGSEGQRREPLTFIPRLREGQGTLWGQLSGDAQPVAHAPLCAFMVAKRP